jgi:hypothetical protein
MAASTKEEIRGWLNRAKQKGEATHVIIVCDTWDHEDYPVETADVSAKISEYRDKQGYRVMEVYNLAMDIEQQLSERRAYNL